MRNPTLNSLVPLKLRVAFKPQLANYLQQMFFKFCSQWKHLCFVFAANFMWQLLQIAIGFPIGVCVSV